jgi:hypothetical protein
MARVLIEEQGRFQITRIDQCFGYGRDRFDPEEQVEKDVWTDGRVSGSKVNFPALRG